MNGNDNLSQWANAHVFYGSFGHKPGPNSQGYVLDEYEWRQTMINNSVNGSLLLDNCFFNDLRKCRKIYLAHTTYNLDSVLERGELYASGGCLVGSIYCVPLTKDRNGLRLHNLGKYIREIEAPLSSKKLKQKLDTIIFEIELSDNSRNNLIGTDYLRLGKIHFSIYKDLEYLLSSRERYDLYKVIVNRAKRSIDFLSLCYYNYVYKTEIDNDYFLRLYIDTIDNLPILGYIYFEVVSEYLMLFQDNESANRLKKQGEFFNDSYKNLMFGINSSLLDNFKLNSYKPTFKMIVEYLIKNSIFKELNANHFLEYLVKRLVFLCNLRLLNFNSTSIDWHKMKWDFDNLVSVAEPLVGHLIHRELRTFGRYPHFYFYFDQNKALQIWNYWNHMDVAIPFNGIIPKGEVGINPAYPDLKYRVYDCTVTNINDSLYLNPTKELRINLVPKLVDLKFTFMRNKVKA